MRKRWSIAALVAVCAAFPAAAQVTEYKLNADGGWVAVPPPPMTPSQETIAKARTLLADNKASETISLLDPWIDANLLKNSPELPEAYLLRADAKVTEGNEYKALYDYEAVIKGFPDSEQYTRAVERELEIAIKYVHGLKRKWLGMRIVSADDVGEELLVRTQERLPGSELAERAGIELADYYYRTRELKLAADAYEIFLANFPRSRYADKARQRRIYANIARFKGPNYDAAALVDARVLIEEYNRTDPLAAQRAGMTDALVSRLEESIAAQILLRAQWYLKRGDPVSARYNLQRLVAIHPQTVAAKSAVKMLNERGWALTSRAATADLAGFGPPPPDGVAVPPPAPESPQANPSPDKPSSDKPENNP